MRAQIDHRGLYVDLIGNDNELHKVIRAVRATGLTRMSIEPGEQGFLAVSIAFPDGGFAAQALPAMLLIAAEAENKPANTMLEQFRNSSGFDAKNKPA